MATAFLRSEARTGSVVRQRAPIGFADSAAPKSPVRGLSTDEVSAAMVHQLNEPLTALLLYLGEIQQQNGSRTEERASRGIKKAVGLAIKEVRRVCSIMERLDYGVDQADDVGAAAARGREAIQAWAQRGSTDPLDSRQSRLTPREQEALKLITAGSSNKEGSRCMGISTRTFEVHRAHLMQKLGARNAADLVRLTLGSGD